MTTRPSGTDPAELYMMPAIFGVPRSSLEEGLLYRDVTFMAATYLAPADKVECLLPEGFKVGAEPSSEPLVTVYCSRNREVDWLGGAGYNILGVDVAATFCGRRERVSGRYSVVLWESVTEAIIGGRELGGIPKFHADISDPLTDGQNVWMRASKNGRPIAELELRNLLPPNAEQVRQAQDAVFGDRWMGWRYIARIGGPGPEISQATVFPCSVELRSVEAAQGTVRFFPSNFADNPTQFRLINLLCELKPIEYRMAFRATGSFRLLPGQVRVLT